LTTLLTTSGIEPASSRQPLLQTIEHFSGLS
jgi:hypothetical protein